VSRVAGPEVLLPHGPPRDYAREIVIEYHTEIGDVFDLSAVVADRAAPRQTTAERVGVLLDRHDGAQTALRSSRLVHEPGGSTGRIGEQRFRRLDQLEQVPPDPGRAVDETGAAEAGARKAIPQRAEQQRHGGLGEI